MKWKIPVLVVLTLLLITSCGKGSKPPNTNSSSIAPPNVSLTEVFDQDALTEAAKKAASSYQDIYYSVPDYPDVSFIIPNDKMEQILNRIDALGYPVSAHDFNLRHSDQMLDFYKAIKSGKDAEIAVFFVDTNGSLAECAFKYHNRQLYMTQVGASWNSSKQLCASDIDFAYIDKFELSSNGYFLYHTLRTKSCQDSTGGFRVIPLPDEDWALYKKYIEPVGYLGNNLFVTTWDKKTLSRLNFNDMFQYIYNLDYPEKDPDYQTPYQDVMSSCGSFVAAVPAKDFESVITKYLPVTAQELQRIATYDTTKKVYPFSYYFIDDEVDITPSAEVVSSNTNKDGSITMVVDVPNLSNYDDCEIRHVLTVMPHKDGSFQYISNVVKINRFRTGWFPYYSTRVSKKVLEP